MNTPHLTETTTTLHDTQERRNLRKPHRNQGFIYNSEAGVDTSVVSSGRGSRASIQPSSKPEQGPRRRRPGGAAAQCPRGSVHVCRVKQGRRVQGFRGRAAPPRRRPPGVFLVVFVCVCFKRFGRVLRFRARAAPPRRRHPGVLVVMFAHVFLVLRRVLKISRKGGTTQAAPRGVHGSVRLELFKELRIAQGLRGRAAPPRWHRPWWLWQCLCMSCGAVQKGFEIPRRRPRLVLVFCLFGSLQRV